MFQFSRAIYRDLVRDVDPDARCCGVSAERHLLAACEAAMHRLETDRRYFARPARRLFLDVRPCFPLSAYDRVWRVVSGHVAAAEQYLDELPANGLAPDGSPIRCPATTRTGTPCRRDPLPRNGYCPSHQHLAGMHGHSPTPA